jgi:hypothetical protein
MPFKEVLSMTRDRLDEVVALRTTPAQPHGDSVTAQGVRNLGQQDLSAVANGKHMWKRVFLAETSP